MKADGDERGSEQATQRALQGAEVEVGAADESVGGSDQPGYLDFIGMSQDLQADGVEGAGNQCTGKQTGKQADREFAETQESIETADPGRVELDMSDLGQGAQLGREGVHGLGRGVGRLDYIGIGQGVFRQTGDDVAHACACLQSFQRFVTRDETPVARLEFTQPGIDLGCVLAVGIELQENADLRCASRAAQQFAQVVQRHVAGTRQGQRDTDYQERKQGVEWGRDKPAAGVAQRVGMLGQVALHGVTRGTGGRVRGAGCAARGAPSTAGRGWR